jgi:hypothetical protein
LQAQAEEPRPVTKFVGRARITHAADHEIEVFYPAPFKRPPHLQILPEGGTVRYSLEQRADGFKAKATYYYAATDQGVVLKWSAEGEIALAQGLLPPPESDDADGP